MASRRKAGVGVPAKSLEGGKDERRGLAGAGLGCGQDVASGQDEGDRRALNGRWIRVALSRDGGEKVGR